MQAEQHELLKHADEASTAPHRTRPVAKTSVPRHKGRYDDVKIRTTRLAQAWDHLNEQIAYLTRRKTDVKQR